MLESGRPAIDTVLMEWTHPSFKSLLSQHCETLCMDGREEESSHEDHGTWPTPNTHDTSRKVIILWVGRGPVINREECSQTDRPEFRNLLNFS